MPRQTVIVIVIVSFEPCFFVALILDCSTRRLVASEFLCLSFFRRDVLFFHHTQRVVAHCSLLMVIGHGVYDLLGQRYRSRGLSYDFPVVPCVVFFVTAVDPLLATW